MTQRSFQYQFDWSASEYAKGLNAVIRHQERSLLGRSIGFVVTWGFGAFLVWTIWRYWGDPQALLATVPWALLLGLLVWLKAGGAAWIQARQFPKEGRGPIKVWVSDTEVGSSSRATSVVSPWDAISKVVEERDHFLFYFTSKGAFFLPKKLVPDPELQEIRSLAGAKVTFVQAAGRRSA